MIKKLLAFFAAMTVFAALAAVDVNKATEAELDAVKGIGPVTTKLIVSERKKGEFKNWADFVSRVKGAAVATKNAVVETAKDVKAAVVTKTEKNDAKPATVVNADTKASASKPAASAAKK